MSRRVLAPLVATTLVFLAGAPAYADSFNDPGNPGDGPNPVALFFVFGGIALTFGIVGLLWRTSAARRMAQQAGLDPDDAVTTTMLSHNGLAATYLAANLRPQPTADDEPPVYRHIDPPTRSTESRLGELKRLHDEGLITAAEYDKRRAEILDTV